MKAKKNQNLFALILDKMGSWSLLILIGVVMAFANSKFLTSSNIINVLRQIAVVTIGAVGVSFVILGGGFDLSTGMIATFAGCNSAAFIVKLGPPFWWPSSLAWSSVPSTACSSPICASSPSSVPWVCSTSSTA